jgi:hypothetical protein
LPGSSNAARVTVWCVVSPALLCFGGQFSRGSSTPVRISASSGSRRGTGNVDAAIAEHLPAWATAAALMLTIVSFAAAAAVIILLALPPANVYFRKPPVLHPMARFPAPPGYPPPNYPPQVWRRPPDQ